MHKKILSAFMFLMQIKSAREGQTLTFVVSKREYSKISVEGDRIVSLREQNTAFENRQFGGKEDNEGAVFIRPLDAKVFSVFVATEAGRHFTLMHPMPGTLLK